jgi:hypothetical protein
MHPAASTELVRGDLPHPGRPGTRVAFFSRLESALAHLRDHVLTAPESEAWAVVEPALASHVDLGDPDRCAAFYRQALASRGLSAQAVFDCYRQAAARAASEAYLLTWQRSEGATTVALGTTGVLVVIDGPCVVTVYLPGQGSEEAVRQSRNPDAGGLPRQRRLMRRAEALSPREQRQRSERTAQLTLEEQLYYRVFRPVVQFLRSRYHRAYTLDGWRRYDDALLKEVLPPMSRLRFDDWRQYRAQLSTGGRP